MENNDAAKAIFDRWLEPLRDVGVRRNVIEPIGSTDHVPFDEAGIPAFTAIKDFRNYDVRTRHTNADLADAVNVDDLDQSAVVLAVMAWHAAMRDEPIPRRKRDEENASHIDRDDRLVRHGRRRDAPLRADDVLQHVFLRARARTQITPGDTVIGGNMDYAGVMVLGSERPLRQAFQQATTLRWLMADYGSDERTASMLMGQAVEYEIANVVDPHVTVVARLRKSHLPARWPA
jgi:hypothetical protein